MLLETDLRFNNYIIMYHQYCIIIVSYNLAIYHCPLLLAFIRALTMSVLVIMPSKSVTLEATGIPLILLRYIICAASDYIRAFIYNLRYFHYIPCQYNISYARQVLRFYTMTFNKRCYWHKIS